jgi:hypothetical protein
VFQHRFAFDLPEIAHQSSDNYFELYPREKKTVDVELASPEDRPIAGRSFPSPSSRIALAANHPKLHRLAPTPWIHLLLLQV